MLRPYQSRAVEFLLPRKRGFIIAPAGSGKTVMAAAASAQKASAFDRVVWLANTREQCSQAEGAIGKMAWADPVKISVHCVAARPDVSTADLVIIDEAHHLPARTWWETVMYSEAIIWGFSATPWSGDWERDGVLKAFFGEENFLTIPRKEVLDGGSLTKGYVVVHDIDTAGEFDTAINAVAGKETAIRARRFPQIPRHEHERRAKWQATIEQIRANTKRNDRICDLANGSEDSCLVLVSSIEHGESLQARIFGSVLVHAKIGKKKRAEAIDKFRSGELRVMIATSLADEGLDVPRAAVLILAAGGRSAAKLEQRAGRVMRPHESKDFGTVHDFTDCGSVMGHSQFKARARTYKKLGYTLQ